MSAPAVTNQLQAVLDALAKKTGTKPRWTGQWFECRCPAHDDRAASLGVKQGDHALVFKCHAGCTFQSIVAALGMKEADMFTDDTPQTTGRPKQPAKQRKTYATLDAAVEGALWAVHFRSEIPRDSLVTGGLWQYLDGAGKAVGAVVRVNLPPRDGGKPPKEFVPLSTNGGKWQIGDPAGKWPLYRRNTFAKGCRVYLCEGEKAADAAASLGLIASTTAHGSQSPAKSDWTGLAAAGVDELVILPDADPQMHDKTTGKPLVYADGTPRSAGMDYARAAANLALAHAELVKVKIVALPGLPPKGDMVEWLEARAGVPDEAIVAELEQLVEAAPAVEKPFRDEPTGPAEKPAITITAEEHHVTERTIAALAAAKDDKIYQRSLQLVRVVRNKRHRLIAGGENELLIDSLPEASLRETLCQHIRFQNAAGQAIHPKPWLISQIMHRKNWPGIPNLEGISEHPIIRADGSIFDTPGYDERTEVYFNPPDAATVSLPKQIGDSQIRQAVAELYELVCDYQFEEEMHRDAFIAAILTPLARFAFEGQAPFFMIDANIRGSGKSKLADLVGIIASGREMPRSTYSHDSVEMRKYITAVALSGNRMVLLDNIAGLFGNEAIDRMLTSSFWDDRMLGTNQTVKLPLRTVWYGTANNASMAADVARRTIHVRLNVLHERPEERTDFTHQDLLTYAKENRARLLRAAMTIICGYLRSGQIVKFDKAIGSFEGWSAVVRAACKFAGLHDPVATQAKLAETSDTSRDALNGFMTALEAMPGQDPYNRGFYVNQLLATVYAGKGPGEWPADDESSALRAAIEALVGGKQIPPSSVAVGKKINAVRTQIVGGRMLQSDNERRAAGRLWRLVRTDGGAAPEVAAAPSDAPLYQSGPVTEGEL